jgi:uncharacterized protein
MSMCMSPKADAEPQRRRPTPIEAPSPRELPIFPLSGALLLPRGRLPLNIFEPRYLAMVNDALAGSRMIGMVQPLDPDSRAAAPPVYGLGCAGRITSFTETDDGRYRITLTGVSRFIITTELPEAEGGYRRVVPSWDHYARDSAGEESGGLDRPRLLTALRCYFKAHGLSAEWSAMENAPEERLVNSLAIICPFLPCEKQAMLEAADLTERANLLIALVEMDILGDCDGFASRTH